MSNTNIQINTDIRNSVISRSIKLVWHFTRISSIGGIVSDGLRSRASLEQIINPPVFNDQYRHDGQTEAICCSISHPNYKMFYSLRQQFPDERWLVVAIEPKVLWEKDCAFCVENAASSEVTSIPIGNRKGIDAFEAMFAEFPGAPNRSVLHLADSHPTNPQAEVLVYSSIELSYIVGVACKSLQTKRELIDQFPGFQFKRIGRLYSARHDYAHW